MKNSKMYDVTTETLTLQNKTLYSVGRDAGVIFCMDIESKEVEKIIDMPNEDRVLNRLYSGICADSENLVLIPFNAQKVWLYCLESRVWNAIDISAYVNLRLEGKFVGGFLHDKILYLLGYQYKNVLMVDLNSKEIRVMFEEECHRFWSQSIVNYQNKVYAIDLIKNVMLCIDLCNPGKYEMAKIKGMPSAEDNSNPGIAFDGYYFYIIKHHGKYVYRWEWKDEYAVPIEIDNFYDKKEPFFNGGTLINHKLFLYSPKGKTYIYNCNNPANSFVHNDRIYFAKAFDNVGIVVCKKGKISILNEHMQETCSFDTVLNNQEHDSIYSSADMEAKVLKESQLFGLDEFLKNL